MIFTARTDIDLDTVSVILKRKGLNQGGIIQKKFTMEVIRYSDLYTPFDVGTLKNNVAFGRYYEEIIYKSPYARIHWFGKVMVIPGTDKGAYFSKNFGFWSPPGVVKEVSSRKMNYQGSPRRGAFWVTRAWNDNKESIIKALQQELERGGNK